MTRNQKSAKKRSSVLLPAAVFILAVALLTALTLILRNRGAGESAPAEETSAGPDAFYYSTLPAKGKELYTAILDAALAFESTTPVLLRSYDANDLPDVLTALEANRPELFYVDFSSCELQSDLLKSRLSIGYLAGKDEIVTMQMNVEAVAAAASAFIGGKGSSFEKEVTLHDFLIGLCSFSSRRSPFSGTVYGALVEKSADGEGYAKAMQFLLRRNGVSSILVRGEVLSSGGERKPHVWDLVRLGNAWYHLDASWDDADAGFSGEEPVFHAYFNLSDEEISSDHVLPGLPGLPAAEEGGDYFTVLSLRPATLEELRDTAVGRMREVLDSGGAFFEIAPSFDCDEESVRIRMLEAVELLRREGRSLRSLVRVFSSVPGKNIFSIQVYPGETALPPVS